MTAALMWRGPGCRRDPLRRPRGRQPAWASRRVAASAGAAAAAAGRLLVPQTPARSPSFPRRSEALVVPIAVEPTGGPVAVPRDIAAITYGANPHKKGLDRVLAAWAIARVDHEVLLVAGATSSQIQAASGPRPRRFPPASIHRLLEPDDYRAPAARPGLRDRAAPRGLRRRPARGPRGRLRARHQRGAGALRGPSARTGPRRALGRSRRRRRRGAGDAIRAAIDDPGPAWAPHARRGGALPTRSGREDRGRRGSAAPPAA